VKRKELIPPIQPSQTAGLHKNRVQPNWSSNNALTWEPFLKRPHLNSRSYSVVDYETIYVIKPNAVLSDLEPRRR
jgi:hypothetical protein